MTDTTLPAPVASHPYPQRGKTPADTAPPAPAPAEPSPEDRLAESRAIVRSALQEIAHPPRAATGSTLGDKLASAFRGVPGAAIILDTAKGWWKDQRRAARTTGQASHALLKPVVKRYPAGVVGAAVAGGAVLFLLKPWRWLLRPRFLLAVGSLVATQAIKGRSTGAWLQTLLNLASKTKRLR